MNRKPVADYHTHVTAVTVRYGVCMSSLSLYLSIYLYLHESSFGHWGLFSYVRAFLRDASNSQSCYIADGDCPQGVVSTLGGITVSLFLSGYSSIYVASHTSIRQVLSSVVVCLMERTTLAFPALGCCAPDFSHDI